MPVYKSRIRFRDREQSSRPNDSKRQVRRSLNAVNVDNPDSENLKYTGNGDLLYPKRRVPFTEQLANPVRSELSSRLAALKASELCESDHSLLTLSSIPTQQPQEDDRDDPPISYMEMAPIYRPIDGRLQPTDSCAIEDEDEDEEAGPSAYLFAVADVFVPVDDNLIPVAQALAVTSAASDDCAIIDDDDEDPPASLLVETRQSLVDYIRPIVQPSTAPPQPEQHRPTLLQRVVTLFAGRGRQSSTSNKTTPRTLPKLPSHPHQPSPPASRPHTPQESATKPFSIPRRPTRPKTYAIPPPILASPPYRPREESLTEPFISPALSHAYTGYHAVIPDVFPPTHVQRGFHSSVPSTPASPILATRRQHSTTTLLDRDKTAWGNWYAQHPLGTDLPFAKTACEEAVEGITELQAWDEHREAVRYVRTRSGRRRVAVKERVESVVARREQREEEEVVRLRNPPGHCFDVVVGGGYPFQHGMCW